LTGGTINLNIFRCFTPCILTRNIFAFNGFGEARQAEQEGLYREKSMIFKVHGGREESRLSHPVGVFMACNHPCQRVLRQSFGADGLVFDSGSTGYFP